MMPAKLQINNIRIIKTMVPPVRYYITNQIGTYLQNLHNMTIYFGATIVVSILYFGATVLVTTTIDPKTE